MSRSLPPLLLAVGLLSGCAAATPRSDVVYPYSRPPFVKEADWQGCDPQAHARADREYRSYMAGGEGAGFGLIGAAIARGSAEKNEPRYRQIRDELYEDEMNRCLQRKGYPLAPTRPAPESFTK